MEENESEFPIHVWAVATNGEALFRHGVSESSPMVNFMFYYIIFFLLSTLFFMKQNE